MPDGYSSPPSGGSVGDYYANQAAQTGATPPPAGGGGGQQVDPLDVPIYLGQSASHSSAYEDTPQGFGSQGSTSTSTNTSTIAKLLRDFERMEHHQQRRMALMLLLAGYSPGGGSPVSFKDAGTVAADMTLNETVATYLDLLQDAAGRYLEHGQKVTPDDLLKRNIAYRIPRGSDWDGTWHDLVGVLHENGVSITGNPAYEDAEQAALDRAEEAAKTKEEREALRKKREKAKERLRRKRDKIEGTRTSTSTDSATTTDVSRDIMDPNDAMALTRAMLQRELDRDPTQAEMEDFISAVQAAQRSHPTRTTSTSTRDTTMSQTKNRRGRIIDSDSDVTTSSSSTTQSGITQAGIEDMMLRRVRANPDWAEWQAVGTYAPALFQALGSTVPGV